MSAPWTPPPPPDRRGHKDFYGRPVLSIVGGVRHNVKTQYGESDVVHVTIVSLAGPDAGTIYTDVHVYTARVAGRLRACEPGQVVLSKVVDTGKAPDLADPDQWDNAAATAWFNANPGLLDHLRRQAIDDFAKSAMMAATTNNPVPYQGPAAAPAFATPPPPPASASVPATYTAPYEGAVPPMPPLPPADPSAPPAAPPPATFAPTPNPNYTTTAPGTVPNGAGTFASMQPGAPAATPAEAGF